MEGKLDKCFLPTEGRGADVAHKFVKKPSPSYLLCIAQTGFSVSAEGLPLSGGLIMTFILESRWYLLRLEPKPLIVPNVLIQNR